MTTTTAIQRPDTHEMIVVHLVFRRESDLMPTLIRAVPDVDIARAGVPAQAFSDYQLGLHLHHTSEDELLWPPPLARVDLQADMVLRMEAHTRRSPAPLRRLRNACPPGTPRPPAATAAPLVSALATPRRALEHLHHEEEYILPLIHKHLTVAEWGAWAGGSPGSPQGQDAVLSRHDPGGRRPGRTPGDEGVPACSARFVWKVFGQRQFRRRVSKIRAWPERS